MDMAVWDQNYMIILQIKINVLLESSSILDI